MRVTLIHNPGAGKQEQSSAKALMKLLRGEGHKPRYQSAKEKGWARVLAWLDANPAHAEPTCDAPCRSRPD